MSHSAFIRQKEENINDYWNGLFQPKVNKNMKSCLITFPFPYVNGVPHMGHILTMMKAEMTSQYLIQKGYNVKFCVAFHATGMPIVAAAQKIQYELEGITTINSSVKSDIDIKTSYKSVKSKLQKGNVSQIETLLKMGVPEQDIKLFIEPWHWVEYFIPIYKQVFQQVGFTIDTSCQFTTTEKSHIYSRFIDWQFNQLNKKGKLKYGKRYTIWSSHDNQPCQDHDRSTGEGINCQEYTLVRFKLEDKLETVTGDIYLLTATLRPETMFGLTNLWVHPDFEYGIYTDTFNDNTTTVIMMEHAYNNLKYQEHQLTQVGTIMGHQLVGFKVYQCQIKNPIYVLPMLQISNKKGTGIVSSVPSESPDDYLNLYILAKEDHPHHMEMFSKYPKLTMVMVKQEPISIIEANNSHNIAIKFCQDNNIKNPSALTGPKLINAKKEIYNQSRNGFFIIDKFNGQKVSDVIPELKEIYNNKEWFDYAEPESEVISRTGDVCVVALDNQWFIDYGEKTWKQQVKEHIDTMEFYSDKAKQQFLVGLDWLEQWPCTRTSGMGTKLKIKCPNPDDNNNYMICSLSDSTIYMALYTIYDILETLPIEMINDNMFNYVFLNIPIKNSNNYDMDKLNKMVESFNYWYPMDLRVSGKDLTQNHLLMCLYNHIAIFPKEKLPKSFRINGHIAINKVKMSKSKGNFITANYILKNYSADALRLTVAHGTSDPIVDTNYESKQLTEDGMPEIDILMDSVNKLNFFYNWFDETMSKMNTYRRTEKNFFDELFNQQVKQIINETNYYLSETVHCEAVNQSFNKMIQYLKQYTEFVDGNYHYDTIEMFVHIFARLNVPFVPHLSEYIYQKLNPATKTSVRFSIYPLPVDDIDMTYMSKYRYITNLIDSVIKFKLVWFKKNNTTDKDLKTIRIIVGDDMVEWESYVAMLITDETVSSNMTIDKLSIKDINKILAKDDKLKDFKLNFKKKVQPFVADFIKNHDIYTFNKLEFITSIKGNLKSYFGSDIEIVHQPDANSMKPRTEYLTE
jgi:leucyl-tRNA synthetase